MNYITRGPTTEVALVMSNCSKPGLSQDSHIIFSLLAFIKNKNKRLRGQEYKIKLL